MSTEGESRGEALFKEVVEQCGIESIEGLERDPDPNSFRNTPFANISMAADQANGEWRSLEDQMEYRRALIRHYPNAFARWQKRQAEPFHYPPRGEKDEKHNQNAVEYQRAILRPSDVILFEGHPVLEAFKDRIFPQDLKIMLDPKWDRAFVGKYYPQ